MRNPSRPGPPFPPVAGFFFALLRRADRYHRCGNSERLRGFNIIGVHGRPLVTLSFETQAEADSAHKAMVAKLIVPHIQ